MKKKFSILTILSIAILASCGGQTSDTAKPTESITTTTTTSTTTSNTTTVKHVDVETITIANGETAIVNEGETLQLTASVLPEDATDKTITWRSENEEVGTVDQTGLFTAKEVKEDKTVTITAKAGEKEAHIVITVKNVIKAATVTFTGEHATAMINEQKDSYFEGDVISFKVVTESGYDIDTIKVGETALDPTSYGYYSWTLLGGENVISIVTKVVDLKGYSFQSATLNPHYAKLEENGDLKIYSNDWNSNLFVKEQTEEIKNTASYTISAHIQTESNAPVDYDQMALGFVVYYENQENYLIAYTQWVNFDKDGWCREFNLTGFVNGEDVSWHDMWLEGAHINPHDGIDFSVTREKTNFNFSLNYQGTEYKKSTSIDQVGDKKTTSLGIFNQDRKEVTYSSITYKKYVAPSNFEITSGNATVKEEDGKVIYNVPTINWKTGFAVKNYEELAGKTKYTISTHLQTTSSTPFSQEAYWGIVLYYENEANFLMLYEDYNADRPNGRSLTIIGNENGSPIQPEWGEQKWLDDLPIHPQNGFDVEVKRDGLTFTTKVTQGSTVIDWEYTRTGFDGTKTGTKVGLWGNGAIGTITATNFKVAL